MLSDDSARKFRHMLECLQRGERCTILPAYAHLMDAFDDLEQIVSEYAREDVNVARAVGLEMQMQSNVNAAMCAARTLSKEKMQ